MTSIFSYFRTVKQAYSNIAKQEQRVHDIFAEASSSSKFSTSISAFNKVVMDAYKQVASSFNDVAQFNNLLTSEMEKSSD